VQYGGFDIRILYCDRKMSCFCGIALCHNTLNSVVYKQSPHICMRLLFCVEMMPHSQHTYTNLHHAHHDPDPNTEDTEDTNATRHTCTAFRTCLHACVGSLVKVLCFYTVCAVLDVFAFVYKQIILYWCALLICVMLSLCCVPCASIVLFVQAGVGVVLYLFWFNIFNLWDRPHSHYTQTWPWLPIL